MKVLHIITGLHRGGAEAVLYRLIESSRGSDTRHVVVSLMPGGIYEERLRDMGIPVQSLGMRSGRPSLSAFLKLRAIVRRENPDVIHSWMYHAAIASVFSAQGRPLIAAIHHSLDNFEGEKFMTRQIIYLTGRLSSRVTRMLYCSQMGQYQHEVIGYDAAKSVMIPNGFDCDLFHPDDEMGRRLRQNLGIPRDAFVFGHVGRFHPVKDHANVLSAFALVATENENARLVMAGGGVTMDNPAIAQMVQENDLAGRVHLLGERDDIPAIMTMFDVLVNGSRGEAFPNVLGEAMATGVPCIATNVGDSAYILGETGRIVPPANPEALAEAMLEFATLQKPALQALGQQARQVIQEKFSLHMVSEAYDDLYRSVCRQKGI